MVPWIHIGGEGPNSLKAGYYLAGYDIPVSETLLDFRGEIFIPFIFSVVIRVCDVFQLPIRVSAYAAVYTLSILCAFGILFAYRLGSSLFDDTMGLYFSILFGLSYLFWYYSQQVRNNSLCATLMLAATYFFWKSLQEDSEWHWFVLWGLFTTFAFETEYFGALLLPFYILYILSLRKIDWIADLFFLRKKNVSSPTSTKKQGRLILFHYFL